MVADINFTGVTRGFGLSLCNRIRERSCVRAMENPVMAFRCVA